VPARLEALGQAGGLDRAAVHSQAGAGLHLVLHLTRTRGRRRLSEVAVLTRHSGEVCVEAGIVVDPDGTVRPGPAADRLSALVQARR
jgi:pilus assembly protein CpaF